MSDTLTNEQTLAVVSELARGRSVEDTAVKCRVPKSLVFEARTEFGPGMGELATSAERLRGAVGGRPAGPVQIPSAAEAAWAVLERAEKFPSLAVKAAKVRTLMQEITDGLGAAEKRADAEQLVAARRADLAKAEALLAELKGTKPVPVHEERER